LNMLFGRFSTLQIREFFLYPLAVKPRRSLDIYTVK
jgi:hypothetical protein